MIKFLNLKQNLILLMLLFTVNFFFPQSLNAQGPIPHFTCTLDIFDPGNNFDHPYDDQGGAYIFCNSNWSASSNENWIIINNNNSSGSGDSNFLFNVTDNNTGNFRSGLITITTCGGVSVTISVSQPTQQDCYIYASPNNFNFEANSVNSGLFVNSNIDDWSVSSNRSWITVTKYISSIYFQLTNNTGNMRSGSITIYSPNCSFIITITQQGVFNPGGGGPDDDGFTQNELNGETGKRDISISNVFPNPTSSFLNISLNEIEEAVSGILMNISGKVVRNFDMSNTLNYKLDIFNLTPGVYLLNISSASKTILEEKIVIE